MASALLTRRGLVAALFFLLAAEIAVFVGAYFYLNSVYPTTALKGGFRLELSDLKDPLFLQLPPVEQRKGRREIFHEVLQENVAEAKKHGYTDKEIVEYLAWRNPEKRSEYMLSILVIEATLFLAALLVALGIIVLTPKSPKGDK